MWFASKGTTRIRNPSFAKSKPASLLVPNPNYKSDLDYAFKINRLVLTFAASWQSRSPFFDFLRKLYCVLQILLIGLFCVVFFIDLNRNPFLKGTILVNASVVFVVYIGYYAKYIVTIWHMTEIRVCYEHMKADWKYVLQDGYETMKEGSRFGHKLSAYYVSFVAVTLFCWHLNALSMSSIVLDGVRYHVLGYPADFYFFDARLWPAFPFVYIFQVYIATVTLAAMCHNCAGAAFVAHASAQCEILISMLIKVPEQAASLDVELKLAYVVKKHNEVLRFMDRFNGVFTWVYLTEWIACISTLCVACYLTITQPFTVPNVLKNLTLFFTGTNTFSVLCYVGERYTTVSSKFGDLAAITSWYLLPKKHLTAFSFIQVHGKKSKFVTAGRLINLTMETFSDVMQRTLAFFNVLKSSL